MLIAPVNQNQWDALISFLYNLGYENLSNSTLLKKLNYYDYTGAANELNRWIYAGDKKLQGLIKGRAKEKALFLQAIKEKDMNIKEKINVLGSAETFKKVQQVVEQVEFENKNADGQAKKQIAVKLLNEIIDIPFISESTEAIILGILVDKAVYYFNEFVWKKVS